LLVVTFVSLFSLPLFYRYLGVEMFALSGYISTVTGLFGFADLGLGSAVGRYVGIALGKGDPTAAREYWGTGNLLALPLLALVGFMFGLLGAVFGPLWFNVPPENARLLRACFVVGGLSLFLNSYGLLWNILSQAHLDFKFVSILRIGVSLIQVIPSVGIAWATGNPLWIGLWSVFVGVLQLMVFVWHAGHRYGLDFDLRAANRKRAREMALYTGKTFGTLVMSALSGMIDRMVLGKFAPAADFNPYYICANVGGRLQGLGSAVVGPVFHNTSRAIGSGRETSAAAIYNEMFNFTFGWYLLAAIGAAVWHSVLLNLWLGDDLGGKVAPLFTPIVVAFCLTGIASVSSSQLGPLNRMGTSLAFTVATGLLTAAGVYIGWRAGGVVGVAYGFLASRIMCIAQDLYVIRMIGARGWLEARTWLSIVVQGLVGAGFALVYLVFPENSLWLVLPAVLHGALVAAWLLRIHLRKLVAGRTLFRSIRAGAPTSRP